MANFTIEGIGNLGKHLEGAVLKGAKRGLRSAALRTVGIIVNEVIPSEPKPPIDRRIYASGFRVSPNMEDLLAYDVINTVPYSGIIEDGARREHIKISRPMIEALTSWVQRKGLASNATEATRMAWAIAQTFKKKGIFNEGSGLHIFLKAMTKVINGKIIQTEINREIRRAIQESFK